MTNNALYERNGRKMGKMNKTKKKAFHICESRAKERAEARKKYIANKCEETKQAFVVADQMAKKAEADVKNMCGSMEEYNNWLLTKQKGSGNHE